MSRLPPLHWVPTNRDISLSAPDTFAHGWLGQAVPCTRTTLSQGMESDDTGLMGLLYSQRAPLDPGADEPPSPSLAFDDMSFLQPDCSMEEVQIEPGSDLANLRDQLMAPSPGAEETAQVPVKKAFGRLIGKPRPATAVTPPPRSAVFVGGCEVDKKKNRRPPDRLSAERKAVNMRSSGTVSRSRNLRAETSGKHLNNERTHHWAYDRQDRMNGVIRLLTKSSSECQHEFLSNDMREVAMNLCAVAAMAAARQPNSRKLETASANFWGVALALQAHRASMVDWVVGDALSKDRMSWHTLESVMEENQGVVFTIRGVHWNEDMEARKTPKQVASGVKRSIGAHSFGLKSSRLKKLNCLHMLLQSGGCEGLHPDILAMRDPVVRNYDTSSSAQAIQQRKAVSKWGKKAKERSQQ